MLHLFTMAFKVTKNFFSENILALGNAAGSTSSSPFLLLHCTSWWTGMHFIRALPLSCITKHKNVCYSHIQIFTLPHILWKIIFKVRSGRENNRADDAFSFQLVVSKSFFYMEKSFKPGTSQLSFICRKLWISVIGYTRKCSSHQGFF